jgi:3-oxoacyl-[acyl-carrier-protein] synthase-3
MTGPMMQTDAEELLNRGLDVARKTWTVFKSELGWTDDTPDIICTHQVGRVHRRRFYEEVGLNPDRDFSTYEFLGNCGAASLPVTAAIAAERGRIRPGDKLALLGIGSGINCMMLGVEW